MTALVVMALASLQGWSLLGLCRFQLSRPARAAMGVALGTTLLALIVLGISGARGQLDGVALCAGLAVAAAITVAGWKAPCEENQEPLPRALWVILGLLGVLVSWLGWGQYRLKEDGLYGLGVETAADGCLHLSLIHSFTEGQNLWPEQPLYSGFPLLYHYLSDFLSAALLAGGSSLPAAIAVPAVFLLLAAAVLVYLVALEFEGDPRVGCLAVLLVFGSGGLGWTDFVTDLARQPGSLWYPPRFYSLDAARCLFFPNFLSGALLPQRAFLMGLPLLLTIFLCLKRGVVGGQKTYFVVAGAVTASLTLAHLPSLLVVLLAGPVIALGRADRWKLWMLYLSVAAILATPRLLTLSSGAEPTSVPAWQPGWMWSLYGEHNLFTFWCRNAGVFIVLWALVPIWKEPLERRRWGWDILPFAGLFLMANLVNFQPNPWDNAKLFHYWYLFCCPGVAWLLLRWWDGGGWRKPLVILLGMSLTLAGVLDLWRLSHRERSLHLMVDRPGIELAAHVLASTPARSVFLIEPLPNHPVPVLGGRRVFLGYPPWLRSYGRTVDARAGEARAILNGSDRAPALMARYGISYLVVGADSPDPRGMTLEFQNRSYRLFRVVTFEPTP